MVRRRARDLSLSLALRPTGTSTWHRFRIDVPDRPLVRRRFEPAAGGAAAIVAWRIGEAVGAGATPGHEEAAKLRALGYLQ